MRWENYLDRLLSLSRYLLSLAIFKLSAELLALSHHVVEVAQQHRVLDDPGGEPRAEVSLGGETKLGVEEGLDWRVARTDLRFSVMPVRSVGSTSCRSRSWLCLASKLSNIWASPATLSAWPWSQRAAGEKALAKQRSKNKRNIVDIGWGEEPVTTILQYIEIQKLYHTSPEV